MSTPTYDAFFAGAMGGQRKPHPYQRDIATEHALPELVCVPTGCGKTAAIVLGWLWRRSKHESADVRTATPRRLVYCLPMRSLVEQVRASVIAWLSNLNLLANGGGRATAPYQPSWQDDGIPVFTLMGGEEEADWQAHPEREAVLVGTQDMLLSRALNRGYAMKPQEWPIAFGLVNVDALGCSTRSNSWVLAGPRAFNSTSSGARRRVCRG